MHLASVTIRGELRHELGYSSPTVPGTYLQAEPDAGESGEGRFELATVAIREKRLQHRTELDTKYLKEKQEFIAREQS
jgi:hypothetical protein